MIKGEGGVDVRQKKRKEDSKVERMKGKGFTALFISYS